VSESTAEQGRFDDRLRDLEHGRQSVEALQRVAQIVAGQHELQEIVQFVTDESTALTGAQFGAFFYNVIRRDGREYSLYTISGVPMAAFEKFPMPRATEIFRPTYEGTTVVRLDDVLADARYGKSAPYYGMPEGHLPVRSYLAIPVFTPDGQVAGGLFFGHERVGVFQPEHEELMVRIATHAGIAIERARLIEAERDARAEAEARGKAAAALDIVRDGVVMIDQHGVIQLWNRAAEEITGRVGASVLGRPIGAAVPGWERIALDVPVSAKDDRAEPATLPLGTIHGRELWLSIYGTTFENGTVYAFRDATGERELENLRAEVIATVSHELRTPISAVYGAVQTLQAHDLDDQTRAELLEVARAESERLAALIDDILVTSRIDSASIRLNTQLLDPREAVLSAVQRYAPGRVRLELPDELPKVAADPDRLHQVLGNLIDNALKYGANTDPQPVEVAVRTVRDQLRIEVSDRGRGIPATDQSRIFEKFYRLDPHHRQGIRGTGLGLYISRELVHRMNGTIGVDSQEGYGATFWVELPFRSRVAGRGRDASAPGADAE
jgi:PAS domain S-box-containing protein